MDKTLAGLLGAVGSLATAASAPTHASPLDYEAAMQAASYADLLKPIPNAAALWKAAAIEPGNEAPPAVQGDGVVQEVQYHDHDHHHHHHHRRRHRHVVVVAPAVPVPVPHHHHHHHHHHAATVVVPQ